MEVPVLAFWNVCERSRRSLSTIPAHHVGCESGWNAYDGWCYYSSTEYLGFNEAEQRCVDMGGHLASVHSQEVNEFLGSLMQG